MVESVVLLQENLGLKFEQVVAKEVAAGCLRGKGSIICLHKVYVILHARTCTLQHVTRAIEQNSRFFV